MLANPAQRIQEETQKVIDNVGKLMILPSGETPTVATISDKDKLKNQPFFANAKNGDQILIFTEAKKAILYDPISNKIIDVAPVNIGTQSALVNTTPSPQAEKEYNVAILNGTNISGLTQKVQSILKEKTSNLVVIMRDNAKKQDYKNTLVIDLKGENSQIVQNISQTISAQVSTLPDGEQATSDADILIIAGEDYK